jgi:hypothetical protein
MKQYNMKSLLIVTLLLLSSTLTSCDKEKVKMTIVKDCTGVYLRDNSRDYYVCNDEILGSYSAGDKIKVSFDELEECFGILEPVSCEMAHLYESKIEVTEIF